MNERAKIATPAAPQNVTTGPIAGSRKVYASPKGHADVAVPFREIVLSDANEPPVRVYDASGPYTEADVQFDLSAGLPRPRTSWITTLYPRRANHTGCAYTTVEAMSRP